MLFFKPQVAECSHLFGRSTPFGDEKPDIDFCKYFLLVIKFWKIKFCLNNSTLNSFEGFLLFTKETGKTSVHNRRGRPSHTFVRNTEIRLQTGRAWEWAGKKIDFPWPPSEIWNLNLRWNQMRRLCWPSIIPKKRLMTPRTTKDGLLNWANIYLFIWKNIRNIWIVKKDGVEWMRCSFRLRIYS